MQHEQISFIPYVPGSDFGTYVVWTGCIAVAENLWKMFF